MAINRIYASKIPSVLQASVSWVNEFLHAEVQLCEKTWFTDRILSKMYGNEKCRIYLYLRSKNIRYCPICLSQLGYWLQMWDLPLFHACPLHQVKLITHCQSCGRQLAWGKIQSWVCICGENLTKAKAEQAAAGWIARAAFISHTSSFSCPERYRLPDVREASIRVNMKECYFSLSLLARLDEIFSGAIQLEADSHTKLAFCFYDFDRLGTRHVGKELLFWPNSVHEATRRFLRGYRYYKNVPEYWSKILTSSLIEKICNEYIKVHENPLRVANEIKDVLNGKVPTLKASRNDLMKWMSTTRRGEARD